MHKLVKNNCLQTLVGVYKFKRWKDKSGNTRDGYVLDGCETLESVLQCGHSRHFIRQYRLTKNPILKNEWTTCFTPVGHYSKQRIAAIKPEAQTKLVHIDLDGKANPQITDWPAYRDYLFKKYTWIAVCSLSCGGAGLFILANTTGWRHYAEHFYAVSEIFEGGEGLNIDTSVSSPNELRFVALPEDVQMRADATVFTGRKKPPVNLFERVAISGDGKLISIPAELHGKMHYDHAVQFIGRNICNAVSKNEVTQFLITNSNDLFEGDTLRGDEDRIIKLVDDLYSRYGNQFGQAKANKPVLTSPNSKLAQAAKIFLNNPSIAQNANGKN